MTTRRTTILLMGGLLLLLLSAPVCTPEETPDDLPTITCVEPKDGEVGRSVRTITSGGLERTFRLYVPTIYDPSKGHALVFDMHGFGGNMDQQAEATGYEEKAEVRGFIVVHPQGVDDSWNGGSCCGTAAEQNIDDVGFISDMIDAISAEYCIDPRYVFATGMSNGGFMSHRLGCELADRIAAIGPNSGIIGIENCSPARNVPVLQSHGTRDVIVPYEEGVASAEAWAEHNGCGEKAVVEEFRDAVCEEYADCNEGASVRLCSFSGGHTWPVSDSPNAYDATDATWAFFKDHPMP
ncbi:MAG: hydrolase [Deltaproteobacteria bacterium]|nr:MAG: hydrolase [Deltaproteobacteria bacterium]